MKNHFLAMIISILCLSLALQLHAADERKGEKTLRFEHEGILIAIRPNKAKVDQHKSELQQLFAEYDQEMPAPPVYDGVKIKSNIQGLDQICAMIDGISSYTIYDGRPCILSYRLPQDRSPQIIFLARGIDVAGSEITRLLFCTTGKNIYVDHYHSGMPAISQKRIEFKCQLNFVREAFAKGLCKGLGPDSIQSFLSPAHSPEMRKILKEFLELGVKISELEVPDVVIESEDGFNPKREIYYDPDTYEDVSCLPNSNVLLFDSKGISRRFGITVENLR